MRILQGDEDGPRGPDDDEDSELEYDALNDETFGAAMKGDWEDLHENLVQLERTVGSGTEIDDDDDDDNLPGLPGKGLDGQRDAFRNDFHSLGKHTVLRLTKCTL